MVKDDVESDRRLANIEALVFVVSIVVVLQLWAMCSKQGDTNDKLDKLQETIEGKPP